MKISLNLATRTYVNRRKLIRCYLLVALLLVLGALYGASVCLDGYNRNQALRAQIERVLLERKSLGGGGDFSLQPGERETLRQAVPFANQLLLADSFRWTALLGRLEELVPEGVAIRSLQPDYAKGDLSLTAVALGVDELRRFLDALSVAEGFEKSYLLSQSFVKAGGKDSREQPLLQFSINIREVF